LIPALVIIAIVFYVFYFLFIKGVGWGILLFIFGAIGGKMLITYLIPSSDKTAITLGTSYGLSYAAVSSLIIVILGIGFLSKDR
jgi:hypothetical protein